MPGILITGAGRGFGRHLMDVYVERGWTVFPLVRDAGVAAKIRFAHGESCHPIVSDVTSDEVGREVAAVVSRHAESLDVLVNNAGTIRKLRGLENATPGDLEEQFNVHCAGALRCVKAALPFLRKAHRGIIANITSRWGSIGRTVDGMGGGIYSYQIAKCAQNMLSACLDLEFGPQGIRVFAIHPGKLMTEVAAADADTPPREAAVRFADWVEACGNGAPCGIHDLTGGGLIAW